MTVIRAEACHDQARPCCTGSSTAASADTRWSSSTSPATKYLCNHLRQQYQVPVCQFIPADPIDDYVVQLFLNAFSSAELDLHDKVVENARRQRDEVLRSHQQQLDRLRYQARLAERQFNQSDPDNRLVTAELERRWEQALRT